MGITNERTQKRFRELSERASEAESLRGRADKLTDWEQTIQSTGTTPQQFGATLLYLTDINSDDPVRMKRAYERMEAELKFLGEKLGREAPGFDPLAAHPDLAEKVKTGDLGRAAAVELVQHRQLGVLQTEQQQNQERVSQSKQEEDKGLQAVADLGAPLCTADPQFQQKFAYLALTVEIIQATLPPAQWAAAIHQAYQRLPPIPAAAAPAARPNNPARASAAPPPQCWPPRRTRPTPSPSAWRKHRRRADELARAVEAGPADPRHPDRAVRHVGLTWQNLLAGICRFERNQL